MNSYSSPLFIFNHEVRLKILELLLNGPMTQTQIAEFINISASEISRHLSKLGSSHFISKDDRKYTITEYGSTSMRLFGPLKFWFDNSKYFNNHPVNLSDDFILQMDILDNAEFIEGQGFVMIKFDEMIKNAEIEVFTMTDQPFPFGKENVKAHYILPPEFMKYDLNPAESLKLKEIDIRFHDKLPIALLIIDKKTGSIHFPDNTGRIDFNFGFFSSDKKVVAYLIDLWNYYFNTGTPVSYYDKSN